MLFKRISTVEFDFTAFLNRTNQINDYGDVVSLLRDRMMLLECTTKHADKVEFKVGLSFRRERVDIAVICFRPTIFRILFQVIINTGKNNQFREIKSHKAFIALVVGKHSSLLAGTIMNEVVVQTEAIFELQNEGNTGVIEEVLTYMTRVNNHFNTVLGQLGGRTDTTEHQKLGGFQRRLEKQ